ncbi:hypothetical protein [Leisingera sp.]|uniref:hypothetical protein n=1 Tax=Leisingera sp. TaxID=1879318 RepID=UPI002B274BD7|nr:hypothetical protein [Leisingera sp.]
MDEEGTALHRVKLQAEKFDALAWNIPWGMSQRKIGGDAALAKQISDNMINFRARLAC